MLLAAKESDENLLWSDSRHCYLVMFIRALRVRLVSLIFLDEASKMNTTAQKVYLAAGGVLEIPRHSLFYTSTEQEPCHLTITMKERVEQTAVNANERGMLVLSPCTVRVQSGSLSYCEIDFPFLVKLQVFVDKSQHKKKNFNPDCLWGYLPAALGPEASTRSIEYWFLNQTILHADDITAFSDVLKNNEWYDLVDFLLDESCDNSNQRLQVLCSRYGLSVSHFRRLTRYALGKTAKVELRDWRLVRALFELIDGDNNLTTIAMNHGYASLSHFSNEVKDAFGVSPRNLKKILHVS